MKVRSTLQQVFGFMLFTLSIVCGAAADESKLPQPFRGHTANSGFSISYADIDILLGSTFLVKATLSRGIARKATPSIGTRLRTNFSKLTSREGNRFDFEGFKSSENSAYLRAIRESLEALPLEAPLAYFSKAEQLAYWLNLYNVTMLDQLLIIYPEKDLEDILTGSDSLLNQKLLMVAGERLSLNDIQYIILMGKFDSDPRILYGFYQGIIGGPSLRKNAYTGANVYAELTDNIYEFINSNRGSYFDRLEVFRVSSLYNRNHAYFPNFKKSLRAHLSEYLIGSMKLTLYWAGKISPNISNWNIADLNVTERRFGGREVNQAAQSDKSVAVPTDLSEVLTGRKEFTQRYGRFTPEQAQQIKELNVKMELSLNPSR
jgi:hypothetical protein